MNFFVGFEQQGTGMVRLGNGEDGVAVVAVGDHDDVGHAGSGSDEELAGLIRIDLSGDFGAGQVRGCIEHWALLAVGRRGTLVCQEIGGAW